jgi:hypothetical protein
VVARFDWQLGPFQGFLHFEIGTADDSLRGLNAGDAAGPARRLVRRNMPAEPPFIGFHEHTIQNSLASATILIDR